MQIPNQNGSSGNRNYQRRINPSSGRLPHFTPEQPSTHRRPFTRPARQSGWTAIGNRIVPYSAAPPFPGHRMQPRPVMCSCRAGPGHRLVYPSDRSNDVIRPRANPVPGLVLHPIQHQNNLILIDQHSPATMFQLDCFADPQNGFSGSHVPTETRRQQAQFQQNTVARPPINLFAVFEIIEVLASSTSAAEQLRQISTILRSNPDIILIVRSSSLVEHIRGQNQRRPNSGQPPR